MKIVSGGQTGVDRAALDAALEAGIEAGGWCPEGRLAEDGVVPAHYPLTELHGAGYRERTRRNVLDSDGTAIIFFGAPSGGTRQTIEYCIEAGRPHLTLDGAQVTAAQAAARIRDFIRQSGIEVLNVAGPRASGEPRAYDYARAVMDDVLAAGRLC